MLNHGSLFSGIGGFDLAAEWMGWENMFHCEIAKFPRKVLKYYWPEAISYEDIKKTDFTIHRGRIDVLTGGFPCQPYSTAGKRLGKEDDRHLWPEMLRAIREIQPRYVVGENVRGLTNWNGGLVFDEVQADLEAEGYEVLPFLLPACGVGAPHRRDRIWFVAFKNTLRLGRSYGKYEQNRAEIWQQRDISARDSDGIYLFKRITPDADVDGGRENNGQREPKLFNKNGSQRYWQNFPTQSPVCNGDDGLSSRLDGITFSKWRNKSIKGGGNAVVPQIPYAIFKAIEKNL